MLFRDAFRADNTIKKQNYQYENQGGGYLQREKRVIIGVHTNSFTELLAVFYFLI